MQPINNNTMFEIFKPFLPDPDELYLGVQALIDVAGDSYITTLASRKNNLWQRHELRPQVRDALFQTLANVINVPRIMVKKLEIICDGGGLGKPVVKLEMTPLPKNAGKLHLHRRNPDDTVTEMGIQEVHNINSARLLVIKTELTVEEKREFLERLLDASTGEEQPVCLFLNPGDDMAMYQFEWESP